jgi:outer membrane protein TolC
MRKMLLLFFIPAFTVLPVCAEEVGLDEAIAIILESNPDVIDAVKSVREAEENIPSAFSIEKARLGVSGSYAADLIPDETAGPLPSSGEGNLSASANLSVPIIPQVSLSGRINDRASGEVSLSLSPFALPNVSPQQKAAYEKAVVSLEYTSRALAANAENTILSYLSKADELSYAEKQLLIAEKSYNVTKLSYELGESTFTDVQNAASNLTSKRQQLFNARKSRLEAEKSLKLLFGPSLETPEIADISTDELQQRITARSKAVNVKKDAAPYSSAVENYAVDLDRLQGELDRTWGWRPDLSVGSSLSFPGGDFSLSASLSISPSDFQGDKRADIEEDIEDLKRDMDTEQYVLRLEKELKMRSIEIALQALEMARLQLEQAHTLYEEEKILAAEGERTELELLKAEASVISAENGLFQQSAAVLRAQSDYLLLFPD